MRRSSVRTTVFALLLVSATACVSSGGAPASPAVTEGSSNPEVPLLGPEGGPQLLHVREAFWFTDLGEMAATAEVIVVAAVSDVRPGRVVTFDDGDQLEFTDVFLDVEEVWRGQLDGARIQLELERYFVGLPGSRLPRWLESGRTSVLFRPRSNASDIYEPVNTQGAYRVDAETDDLLATTEHDAFADGIGALGFDELRGEMADLIPRIDSGEVQPQDLLPER